MLQYLKEKTNLPAVRLKNQAGDKLGIRWWQCDRGHCKRKIISGDICAMVKNRLVHNYVWVNHSIIECMKSYVGSFQNPAISFSVDPFSLCFQLTFFFNFLALFWFRFLQSFLLLTLYFLYFLSVIFSSTGFFMSLHIFFMIFWFISLSVTTLFTILLLKIPSYPSAFLYYSSLSPPDSLIQPYIYHYCVCGKESTYDPPY